LADSWNARPLFVLDLARSDAPVSHLVLRIRTHEAPTWICLCRQGREFKIDGVTRATIGSDHEQACRKILAIGFDRRPFSQGDRGGGAFAGLQAGKGKM